MSHGHPFHKNTIIVLYVLVFVIQQLVFLHSCADRIKLETGMFHRRMYNACNYHNMHTINLLWMQIIAIYISIIPSTFTRKYTFIDDQMENSLHNMIPNSCHSSQEILRPCWWKSSPNLRVFCQRNWKWMKSRETWCSFCNFWVQFRFIQSFLSDLHGIGTASSVWPYYTRQGHILNSLFNNL